ncbi:D-alanyl-D-alanine carboxypeptidase [Halobacteroides halobius DSM 5150]|uniref:serine-type D-Ala-D-Ala carboxypeptidase n=1 Tax=Halobacteroides halobius (strain ATCC 35273 / DSM 5150 / MD-1) TaxID=748449 RepID=L0K7R1_HALHC|nr:D-alanyl-D-alanine carboxypeptidase family protein [Halobacteroides halobius]AGB40590.1 D-alanyl-D-alanine carboxypeptidase [Halobacteroides halobius DSM 5150]
MRKFSYNLLGIIVLILVVSQSSLAVPNITARAAILIDGETGKILYRKNIHQQRAPASTTKIMTGILAIEEGELNDEVTASKRAAYEGGSSIYLTPGETLKLRELIYGLLVKSGNDAAIAIAEYIGGTVEKFAEMMNRKAKEIGALNTTFQNPNGLPNKEHLTTAYDLAQIARYALKNDFFAQVVSTRKKRISWPQHSWDRILTNTNKLLKRSKIVDGVKTGYTRAAGRCLVASATKDGQQLISVVLKSGSMWNESLRLLNYGFNNYQTVPVIKKGEIVHKIELQDEVNLKLKSAKDFKVVIPNHKTIKVKKVIDMADNISLPIRKDDKLGTMAFYNQADKLLGKVELLATKDVVLSNFQQIFSEITSRIQTYF